MAEHFYGRNDIVHVTNSGCEALVVSLIATGEQMAQDPALAAVVAFLRACLGPHGARAFSLDPPPSELQDPMRLRSLASIVGAFARDLAGGHPNNASNIQWDRKLEMHWLAMMLRLYAVIGEALPPGSECLPPLNLDLAPHDQAECIINQLSSRIWQDTLDAQRGVRPRDPKARLGLVEQILAAAEHLQASESRDRLVQSHVEQCADLLLELGDRVGAAAAYRTAITLERDEEVRQMLEETVADIEGRKPRAEGE